MMRRAMALGAFAFALAVAAGSFVVVPNKTSRASGPGGEALFLIPASDGYGVADCLSVKDSECGKVVATAWCEAQGFARVASFGLAEKEDFTGTVQAPAASERSGQPLAITCAN